jgi:putative Mn2+ efflux pump MntP
MLTTILLLIGAHYVADFAMQNQYVADAKADTKRPDWFHALTAHSAHHAVAAGFALAVLGLPWLAGALVVGVTHWFIDYGKAVRHWYGYHADQAMHIGVAIGVGLVATNI